jgi:hypothetical protein
VKKNLKKRKRKRRKKRVKNIKNIKKKDKNGVENAAENGVENGVENETEKKENEDDLKPHSYDGFSMVKNEDTTIEATKEHDEDDENNEDNENKKGCVDYQKFSFNYYIITDVDFYGKRRNRKKKVEFIPEKQVSILLKAVTKIFKNKGNVVTITKDKNNLKKLYKPLNGKKKSAEDEEDGTNEKDSDEVRLNTRKYDVMGNDKKTKKMSIIEILKKKENKYKI